MAQSGTSDDHDLWAEVTKTVTPADREDVMPLAKQPRHLSEAKTTAKKTPQKKAPVASAQRPISSKSTLGTAVHPADLRSAEPYMRAGIDNASARRLVKGVFEIDDQIDLHGQTEAQAHRQLHQFILRASSRHLRTLLIITGKGAQGMGVLRRKVPEWLKDEPLKSHILAISQASPKDGGGGALYVRLRRQRGQS